MPSPEVPDALEARDFFEKMAAVIHRDDSAASPQRPVDDPIADEGSASKEINRTPRTLGPKA